MGEERRGSGSILEWISRLGAAACVRAEESSTKVTRCCEGRLMEEAIKRRAGRRECYYQIFQPFSTK